MKSIVKDTNKQIMYPCLMIGEETGVIILAYKETSLDNIEGVVVYKGYGDRGIGAFYDKWNRGRFTLFEGTVELSND